VNRKCRKNPSSRAGTWRPRVEVLEDRLAPAGGIAGIVWHDLDLNGVRDAGEPGLAGRNVFIDVNRNSTFDAGEPAQLSASDGSYTFSGLVAGDYAVLDAGMVGWAATNLSGPLAPGSLAPAA
jgi:SdrD B-like domain